MGVLIAFNPPPERWPMLERKLVGIVVCGKPSAAMVERVDGFCNNVWPEFFEGLLQRDAHTFVCCAVGYSQDQDLCLPHAFVRASNGRLPDS